MAPVYDAVTTRMFPGLEDDRMALAVNGRRNRLRRSDFLAAGRTLGLSAQMSGTTIAEVTGGFEGFVRQGEGRLPARLLDIWSAQLRTVSGGEDPGSGILSPDGRGEGVR